MVKADIHLDVSCVFTVIYCNYLRYKTFLLTFVLACIYFQCEKGYHKKRDRQYHPEVDDLQTPIGARKKVTSLYQKTSTGATKKGGSVVNRDVLDGLRYLAKENKRQRDALIRELMGFRDFDKTIKNLRLGLFVQMDAVGRLVDTAAGLHGINKRVRVNPITLMPADSITKPTKPTDSKVKVPKEDAVSVKLRHTNKEIADIEGRIDYHNREADRHRALLVEKKRYRNTLVLRIK